MQPVIKYRFNLTCNVKRVIPAKFESMDSLAAFFIASDYMGG